MCQALHQVLENQIIFVLVSVLRRFVIELERGTQKEDGWSKAHENASGKGTLWCHFHPCAQSDSTSCSWHSFCLKWVVVALCFLGGGLQLSFIKKKMCLLGGNHGKPASVLLSSLLCSSSLGKVESWALCKLHHLLNIRETDTPCSFPPYLWPHQSERKWKC